MTQEGEGTIVGAGSPWPSNMAYSTWTYMCDNWRKVKLIMFGCVGYPEMWAGGVNLMYVYFGRNCEEGVWKAGLWSGPWVEKEKERGLWVVRVKMGIMWSPVRYKDLGLLGYGDNGVSQRELWCVWSMGGKVIMGFLKGGCDALWTIGWKEEMGKRVMRVWKRVSCDPWWVLRY
jgi:hypothetical protein